MNDVLGRKRRDVAILVINVNLSAIDDGNFHLVGRQRDQRNRLPGAIALNERIGIPAKHAIDNHRRKELRRRHPIVRSFVQQQPQPVHLVRNAPIAFISIDIKRKRRYGLRENLHAREDRRNLQRRIGRR